MWVGINEVHEQGYLGMLDGDIYGLVYARLDWMVRCLDGVMVRCIDSLIR